MKTFLGSYNPIIATVTSREVDMEFNYATAAALSLTLHQPAAAAEAPVAPTPASSVSLFAAFSLSTAPRQF